MNYSRRRLPYPLESLEALDDAALESVSALLERFGKLQDMLGSAFREIVSLSGEDATDMNDVLSRLEKVGVLSSADDWRMLRALRNLGADEYDETEEAKTRFINEVAERAAELIELAKKRKPMHAENWPLIERAEGDILLKDGLHPNQLMQLLEIEKFLTC